MANGIEIRNPNGIISIDGNFKNFEVFDSFTVDVPNTFINIPQYRPMPLIFHRPYSYGTTITWNIAFDYIPNTPASANPGTDAYRLPVGHYILARAISSGTGTDSHGIRVWDGSSNVVFDSGKKVINIDSMVLKTPTPEPPLAASWTQVVSLPTHPVGIRYFLLNSLTYLTSYYAYTYDPGDGGPTIDFYTSYLVGGTFDNENQITYKMVVIENTTSDAGGMGLNNPCIPLISGYANL